VPVSAIARVAEVSEATVFNYFPTKEDLVFQGMEAFEAELLAAVRDRAAGESTVAAFFRFALEPRGLLAARDAEAASYLAQVTKMIAASPALQSRQREILARYTASLAAFIADDTGAEADDLRPTVVAHALIATHQALIDFIHRRLLDGPADTARLAERVKILGRDVRDLLEHGLVGYGSENA
jgi:AcrR family transcriptional regulator